MKKLSELECYVKNNSFKIFGKKICWCDSLKFPGAYAPIHPDLVGRDVDGKIVIVEVKSEFSSKSHSDAAHKSVGQVLNYATAYMKEYKPSVDLKDSFKHLRLFIVGDKISKTVKDICKLLRMHGIDIDHIPTRR